MRILMIPITILITITTALAGGPHPGAIDGQSSILMAAAETVVNPWATVPLLLAGMMLVITESMKASRKRLTGLVGALCLGTVLASHSIVGAVAATSGSLLLVGLAFILMEVYLLPGRGVSLLAGLGGIFSGMFVLLSGASSGLAYPVIVSALVTILTAVAFLVHLPNSAKWRNLSRNARIALTSRPEKSLNPCTESTVKIKRVEVKEEDKSQQTHGRNEENQSQQQILRRKDRE